MATKDIHAGEDLQAAIDNAQAGDVLRIESGAVWAQDILFREKTGPVTLTCAEEHLTREGNRVSEEDAKAFPLLMGNHKTSPRGSFYTVRGLKFQSYTGSYTTGLLDLGGSGINGDIYITADADLPRDWTVDRCFFQGDPACGGKRGIAMNCAGFIIRDSVVQGIWSDFQDCQALASWNGPGPFEIRNCKLEGSGENVMFGGAAPSIPNLVPSDIVVEDCWIYKPLSWKAARYSLYTDSKRRKHLREAPLVKVKNQIEFKNGARAQIRRNIFENCWTSAQAGYGILWTVRTCEGGDYSWACIEDIVFEKNWVISENGTNTMGCDEQRDNCGPPTVAGDVHDIVIRDNVIQAQWLFQILSGTCNVTIERNTCDDNWGGALMSFDTNPNGKVMTGLVVRDNRFRYGRGIIGTNAGPGMQALDMYWQQWAFEHNAIHGVPEGDMWWISDPNAGWYPAGNLYCVDISSVPEGEYGCDVAALQAELAHVRDGQTANGAQPAASVLRVSGQALPVGDYDLVARASRARRAAAS